MVDISVGDSISEYHLAKLIRDPCIHTAFTSFEDAREDGLCCEGTWEVALEVVQAIDLEKVIN